MNSWKQYTFCSHPQTRGGTVVLFHNLSSEVLRRSCLDFAEGQPWCQPLKTQGTPKYWTFKTWSDTELPSEPCLTFYYSEIVSITSARVVSVSWRTAHTFSDLTAIFGLCPLGNTSIALARKCRSGNSCKIILINLKIFLSSLFKSSVCLICIVYRLVYTESVGT